MQPGGNARARIVIGQQRDADLPQVIRALAAPGTLARSLNGRQQQRDQQADDGDHDQQLDEREAAARSDRATNDRAGDYRAGGKWRRVRIQRSHDNAPHAAQPIDARVPTRCAGARAEPTVTRRITAASERLAAS